MGCCITRFPNSETKSKTSFARSSPRRSSRLVRCGDLGKEGNAEGFYIYIIVGTLYNIVYYVLCNIVQSNMIHNTRRGRRALRQSGHCARAAGAMTTATTITTMLVITTPALAVYTTIKRKRSCRHHEGRPGVELHRRRRRRRRRLVRARLLKTRENCALQTSERRANESMLPSKPPLRLQCASTLRQTI